MSVLAALWSAVVFAEPVPAITVTGRPVLLNDDGTWRYTDVPEAAAAAPGTERVGAWTIALSTAPVTGKQRGGATTPNLDGPGYLGLACRGAHAEIVVMFADFPLTEVNLKALPNENLDPREHTPVGPGEGAFVFADRARTRVITGPRLLQGAVEGFVPTRDDVLEMLARSPRAELIGENTRVGVYGWPATVRYSLDGFERVFETVDAACRAPDR